MVYTAQNITTALGLFEWVNSITDGIFFQGVIIVAFIISVVTMLSGISSNNSTPKALAAGGFTALVLSSLARLLGLVSTPFLLIWVGVCVVCLIWAYLDSRSIG